MKKIYFVFAAFVVALGVFTNMHVNMGKEGIPLLKLDRMETLGYAEFYIKSNGNVGIFNSNPSVALEIGNIYTSCVIKLNGVNVSVSDSRVKENIHDLKNSLDAIAQLRSVSYNFIGKTEEEVLPDEQEATRVIDQTLKDRNVYGFIAEELREVLPNLVYETDTAGALAIDYNGIIPVLVGAVQEQQRQIEELKGLLSAAIIQRSPQAATGLADTEMPQAFLYQNTPNPWKENTEIRYVLPGNTKTAEIYIFDLTGKLLETLPATNSGVVLLQGSGLNAGLYSYALAVDGVIVDTKKMLLTK